MQLKIRSVLAGCLILGSIFLGVGAPFAEADPPVEKVDPSKLHGTWEMVKSPMPLPPETKLRVTFENESKEKPNQGTIKFISLFAGKAASAGSGIYTLKNDKLIASSPQRDGQMVTRTDTIELLNGERLVTKTDNGFRIEYKRVK